MSCRRAIASDVSRGEIERERERERDRHRDRDRDTERQRLSFRSNRSRVCLSV